MEREIRHEKKAVIYWLSNQESKDHRLKQQIYQESNKFRQQKYRVVVFHSGSENLYTNSKAIIQHNLRQHPQQSKNPMANK